MASFSSGLLLRVDLGDADLLGEVAHLRLAIARHDHHAREVMLRPQVADEGTALRARRIPKAQGRRVAPVNRHHAFESAGERRKLVGAGDFLRDELGCGW